MKEDILEQIGSDWMSNELGVFVKTNLKYKPEYPLGDPRIKKTHVHSDIDIIAVSTFEPTSVKVVNCKSWMDGFNVKDFVEKLADKEKHVKKQGGKEYWKHFRELIDESWHDAFIKRLKDEQPNLKVVDYIVLTVFARHKDFVEHWNKNEFIKMNFERTGIDFTIKVMELKEVIDKIKVKGSGYAENSEVLRMMQLFKAAKFEIQ